MNILREQQEAQMKEDSFTKGQVNSLSTMVDLMEELRLTEGDEIEIDAVIAVAVGLAHKIGLTSGSQQEVQVCH